MIWCILERIFIIICLKLLTAIIVYNLENFEFNLKFHAERIQVSIMVNNLRSKLYYRVYTVNHCEIILLHSYINYYTKYLIWCYGYNFYRIQWPISHYTGQPKCPIQKFSTANIIFTKFFLNFLKYQSRNAWRWCRIFQNSYFISMTTC